MRGVSYGYLNTSGQNLIQGGAGADARLVSIIVGTGAASAVVTVTDATSGATVATIAAANQGQYWFGHARIPGGLKVALTGGNALVTVAYE